MIKDYYSILQVEPSASLQEIKQAYRRLALAWHPDKKPNDPYAKTQFEEIKEAYETLTNPIKKDLYLQERWYEQSIGRRKTALAVTPVNILRLALELERYVSRLDPHRMNREGLFHYIDELLSSTTIEKLLEFGDKNVNRQIVATILSALNPLTIQMTNQLTALLERLASNDERSQEKINQFLINQKKNFLWSRYKFILIIITTILICLLIYFTSK